MKYGKWIKSSLMQDNINMQYILNILNMQATSIPN